jgi:hypothetical protein
MSGEARAVTGEQDATDPIGVVLPGMGFGGALGVGLQGLVTFGVDVLKSGAPLSGKPSFGSAHALVLLLGTPAAMALAGWATWTLLAPIRNPWRQALWASAPSCSPPCSSGLSTARSAGAGSSV